MEDLKLDFSGAEADLTCMDKFFEDWLKPTQARLKSMVLKSARGVPVFPTNLHFTKLRTIKLGNFLFSRLKPSAVETFLVSDPIAPTLQQLTLSGCSICDGNQTYSSNGTWADILQRFQETLRSLEAFHIGTPLSYVRAEWIGYERLSPGKAGFRYTLGEY